MPQLISIHTRQTGGQRPRKARKKLVHGISKDHIEAQWLKTNGWMTKRKGKPPYKFLHRKEIIKIPSRIKKKLKRKIEKSIKQSKKRTKMSMAAKKAWKTRRKKKG